MKTAVVNDIDGTTYHTVDAGELGEVRQRADERLRGQIDRAALCGGDLTETFERDGEEYTVRVSISDE